MTKVKVLDCNSISLEAEVSGFIKDKKVIDIKITRGTGYGYLVMIIYEVDEP